MKNNNEKPTKNICVN